MTKLALAFLPLLLLAGCVTAEQLAAKDDQQCRSYGAKPGDAGYVACRTQLDSTRQLVAATPSCFGTGKNLTCY